MITEIGLRAGEIWKLLDEKNRLELPKLAQHFNNQDLTFMSLGWLCREGHSLIRQQNSKIFLELRQG